MAVPRDRAGEFEPKLLKKYETSSNELEDKIITLYAKGLSVRDIHVCDSQTSFQFSKRYFSAIVLFL